MTDDFSLPFAWDPALCSEQSTAILGQICTPYEAAAAGDVLALCFSARAGHPHAGWLEIFGQADFLCLSADGGFERLDWSKLPEARRRALAFDVMELGGSGLHGGRARIAADKLAEDADTEIDLFVAACATLLRRSEHIDEVLLPIQEYRDLQPDDLAGAFRVIGHREPQSAHQAIRAASDLRSAIRLFSALCPVPGEDGETIFPGLADPLDAAHPRLR